MCGIWGFVSTSTAVATEDAWNGLCSLTDRGPDDWGIYLEGDGKITTESALPNGEVPIALGNRRLSILDLSAAGNQPFVTEDGVVVVYNGEIYNYRELREELRAAGYSFRSDTDTEVLLRSYQEYGTDCVERFRGMFAFGIWDPQSGTLFAARDRLGIKPLYYDCTGQRLTFASEVTSLLAADTTRAELDPRAVEQFLALGSVPATRTILADIESLPAGSKLVYDPATGSREVERYWSPSTTRKEAPTPDEVFEALRESVELRLRSDVPVGAFLSGGLDSSSLVALMRDVSGETAANLRTYSIDFEETAYSEGSYAEQVAERLGTEHTARTIRADDVKEEIPNIIETMDQPTIDGINTYFVSKIAAEDGVSVALSGVGGDELFCGYDTFRQVPALYRIGRLTNSLPAWIRRPVATLLDAVADRRNDQRVGALATVLRSDDAFEGAYLAVRGIVPHRWRKRLLGSATDSMPTPATGPFESPETASPEARVANAELGWYLHNQLLKDTDMMSMAHSLETRVPFLDSRLVSRVMGAQTECWQGKTLLKEALRETLPDTIIDREKTGFTFPFGEWLESDLADVVDDALDQDRLRNTPVDHRSARQLQTEFSRDTVHWSRLWAIVVLSLWVEEHLQ